MASSWVETVFGNSDGESSSIESKEPIRLELLPVEKLVADLSREVTPKSVEEILAERLKKAYQNGFSDGLKEGEASTRKSFLRAEEELQERVQQLESTTVALESMVAKGFEAKASELATFAFEIAKTVMRMDPDLERKRLEHILTEVLREVPAGKTICIRVNPKMAQFLTEVLEEKGFERSSTFQVVSDMAIETAGAVVEQGPTTLDLQLKTATDRIKEALDELRGVRE